MKLSSNDVEFNLNYKIVSKTVHTPTNQYYIGFIYKSFAIISSKGETSNASKT
jgi:hypothetical protein